MIRLRLVVFAALLLTPVSAFAQVGDSVLVYSGHSGDGGYGITAFCGAMTTAGATSCTESTTWPVALTDHRVILFANPETSFTSTEISQIGAYLGAGGTVVLACDGSAYQSCASPLSGILSGLGSTSSFVAAELDSGCPARSATVVATHPLTMGYTSLSYVYTGRLTLGAATELARGVSGQTILAIDEPRGNLVLTTDSSVFLDGSSCSPPGTANNQQLFANLFDSCACNDGNPCTDDVCTSGGGCSFPPKVAGSSCDDGVACTGSDQCDGAGGCAGTALSCDDGLACTSDTCVEAMGGCVNTVSSGCLADGACQADGASNPTNACEVCDPSRATDAWSAAAAGTVCRPSADVCDLAESCDGSSTVCPSDGVASAGTVCRPAADPECDVEETCTGVSPTCPADATLADGTACMVGLVCDGDSSCVSGACVAGTAPDCDDFDVCTEDVCMEPGGCTSVSIGGCCTSHPECDDGSACTTDLCVANSCTNDPVAGCCARDSDCPSGETCDLPSGTCAGAESDGGVGVDAGATSRRRDRAGCCHVAGTTTSDSEAAWLLLGLGVLLLWRRRPRRP